MACHSFVAPPASRQLSLRILTRQRHARIHAATPQSRYRITPSPCAAAAAKLCPACRGLLPSVGAFAAALARWR